MKIQNENISKSVSTHELKPRILLIDDDVVNQVFMNNVLGAMGWQISLVETGLEAIRTLESETFDFILISLEMPFFDSYTTVKIIREFEKSKDTYTPIITVTTSALEADIARSKAVGMNDYISRPINMVELRSKIEIWQRVTRKYEDRALLIKEQ